MTTFRIVGVATGRTVVFEWRDGALTCSDPIAMMAFREAVEGADPIKPRPHVDLMPDLSDRAFVQTYLTQFFLSPVVSVSESPALEYPDDVL